MGKTILSFGGGLQTSALIILVAEGKIDIDEVLFSDTGCEKPETYWYIENYIKPLCSELGLPFITVQSKLGGLYEYCQEIKRIPSPIYRWCTDKFKVRPLRKYIKKGDNVLVGFSADESHRVKEQYGKLGRQFPLIEMGITGADCTRIIQDYGWPVPVKSACYICPYQRWNLWNWLKANHPELMQRAVDLELLSYEKRPQDRDTFGLFGGKPLWKFQNGIQAEFGFPAEYTCWSGSCGR